MFWRGGSSAIQPIDPIAVKSKTKTKTKTKTKPEQRQRQKLKAKLEPKLDGCDCWRKSAQAEACATKEKRQPNGCRVSEFSLAARIPHFDNLCKRQIGLFDS